MTFCRISKSLLTTELSRNARNSCILLEIHVHGVRLRGREGHGPPDFTREGPVMHLAHPDFRKNYVMYIQLIDSDSVFFLGKTMECIHNTAHFIKTF